MYSPRSEETRLEHQERALLMSLAGATQAEIGDALGINQTTAGRDLRRARAPFKPLFALRMMWPEEADELALARVRTKLALLRYAQSGSRSALREWAAAAKAEAEQIAEYAERADAETIFAPGEEPVGLNVRTGRVLKRRSVLDEIAFATLDSGKARR